MSNPNKRVCMNCPYDSGRHTIFKCPGPAEKSSPTPKYVSKNTIYEALDYARPAACNNVPTILYTNVDGYMLGIPFDNISTVLRI